jgi:tRNA (guanine-N7-)-methyltransferase
VGKNKLERWAELKTFKNVIQPDVSYPAEGTHELKGNWNAKIFGTNNPIILELGCGKGEHTVGLSRIFPDCNFIGIDIKGARIWRGAKTAFENQLDNVAFLRTRIEFINSFFGVDEINEIWLAFPDPHLDKKNSNRRLTCPWFLNKYREFLKERGIIHLKTDNEELYRYTLRIIEENHLELLYSCSDLYTLQQNNIIVPTEIYSSADHDYRTRASNSILSIKTHYELKFIEKGLKIFYLAFRLTKDKIIRHGWEK